MGGKRNGTRDTGFFESLSEKIQIFWSLEGNNNEVLAYIMKET